MVWYRTVWGDPRTVVAKLILYSNRRRHTGRPRKRCAGQFIRLVSILEPTSC